MLLQALTAGTGGPGLTDSPGRPQRDREGGKSDACSSLVQIGASLVGHEINLVRGSQN